MEVSLSRFATIVTGIRAAGLEPLAAFHPDPADGVPPLGDGRPAATVILVGNAGPAMWRRFATERNPDSDLLDDWSRQVIDRLAETLTARAVYPFDTPHLPFQRWAARGGGGQSSPLGIYLHPRFGLWHAYRGALLLGENVPLPGQTPAPHACATCADSPCLDTCPVGAFDGSGYDVPACVAHIETPAGADCLALGCRARRACPVAKDAIYAPEQAAFHMKAFLRALSSSG